QRLHNTVAWFAELLGGAFELQGQIFRATPAGPKQRREKAPPLVVQALENHAFRAQELDLRTYIKNPGGTQQALEFEIGDDRFHDERTNVRLLAQIIA